MIATIREIRTLYGKEGGRAIWKCFVLRLDPASGLSRLSDIRAFSRAAWMGRRVRRHFPLIESRTRTKMGAQLRGFGEHDRRHFDSRRAFPTLDDFICA